MLEVTVYNTSGEEAGRLELNPKIWKQEKKIAALHQAIITNLSNSRKMCAATKTRAEVRGGGRKPWRQKGTGRARHGSIRSPIWRGGGVTFGPNKRSYKKRLPKRMKRVALISALSDRMEHGMIKVIDKFEDISPPHTKKMVNIFEALNLKYPLLVINSKENKDVNLRKSISNIPHVSFAYANSINPYLVLKAKQLLITSKAMLELEKRL